MAWRLVRSLVSCRPTHYFAALCEGGLSAGLRASTTALNAAPTGAVAEPAMAWSVTSPGVRLGRRGTIRRVTGWGLCGQV